MIYQKNQQSQLTINDFFNDKNKLIKKQNLADLINNIYTVHQSAIYYVSLKKREQKKKYNKSFKLNLNT